MPRVLFISGSIGLGHAQRDLAIARALRAIAPDVEISWLAGEPARTVLRDAGEALHPLARAYHSDSDAADAVMTVGGMNLFRYAMKAQRAWIANATLVEDVAHHEAFDAVVGDEAYEVMVALVLKRIAIAQPFVMLYDFLGLDATSSSAFERVGVEVWNQIWARDRLVLADRKNRALFVGEVDDIPDRPLGLGLPSRREHARRWYDLLGYILPFEPRALADRAALRAELGYGRGPLVIATIGGTAAGSDLLRACGEAFPLARARLPDLQMMLVCGPRAPAESLDPPPGVVVKQFVPELYRHLAACDLAITQAGGTTTLELTALRRPFVYVPLEGQCEQERVIVPRLERQRAGIRLSRRELTPQRLADVIVANVGTEATWPPISTDGATVAARILVEVLDATTAVAA